MRIFLVRHAATELMDVYLCGRAMDPPLGAMGWQQAAALGETLKSEGIGIVQTSPRRRARETAQAIAEALGLTVEVIPALDEIDLGEWAGTSFVALESDPQWRAWNAHRSVAAAPGGESMAELQRRMLSHVETVEQLSASAAVLVSHAEPIRALIMHDRKIPLDDFGRVEVPPASATILMRDQRHRAAVRRECAA